MIGNLANVWLLKDGPATAELGGSGYTYTITYGNNGNIPAAGVVVSDQLPTGFTYMGAADSNGYPIAPVGPNGFTMNAPGPLAPGAGGTITVAFNVASTPSLVGSSLRNVATISTATQETDLGDNTDDAITTVDLRQLSAISGTVWYDPNEDGILDPTEDGIEGVTITLTGTDIFGNAVSRMTITDENGDYLFSGLNPGTYEVEETQPTGYLSTKDVLGTVNGTVTGTNADDGDDQLTAITLAPGERGIEYNFGETAGTVGDFVWFDKDRDGEQDAGEK